MLKQINSVVNKDFGTRTRT